MATSFAFPTLRSKMKMIGCNESFVEFFIDPDAAQRNVPSRFEVRKFPNGNARLLIMIQEWDKCILDGFLPVRRVKMSHIWIELNGPNEIGPALPGTESSLPTSYYYALPHQIDNKLAVLAFRLVGIDVQQVVRIEVSGDPGDYQSVRVVERENPAIGYSWEAKGDLWSVPQVLTGRRWFYRNYGKIFKRKSAGLVVCRSVFLGESEINMIIDGGSSLGGLGFGLEMPGSLKIVKTDCDCVIDVGKG